MAIGGFLTPLQWDEDKKRFHAMAQRSQSMEVSNCRKNDHGLQ